MVKKSPEKGRFVISDGNFTAGDVLASEPAGGWLANDISMNSGLSDEELAAASCILLPFQRHKRCFACHNMLKSVGYVCPNCNDAAFCGPPSPCFARHFRNGFKVPQWHKDECRYALLMVISSSADFYSCWTRLDWGTCAIDWELFESANSFRQLAMCLLTILLTILSIFPLILSMHWRDGCADYWQKRWECQILESGVSECCAGCNAMRMH